MTGWRAAMSRVRRWAVRFFAVLGVILSVYLAGFDLSVIGSNSMSPTLQGDLGPESDVVLSERVSYWFRHPRRWEIVRFYDALGIDVMKRIVAIPGERVSLTGGRLRINAEPAEPPGDLGTLRYVPIGNIRDGHAVQQGYYVLGDHSIDSQDSRFDGEVAAGRVRYRAWMVVWPPHRIRLLSP